MSPWMLTSGSTFDMQCKAACFDSTVGQLEPGQCSKEEVHGHDFSLKNNVWIQPSLQGPPLGNPMQMCVCHAVEG